MTSIKDNTLDYLIGADYGVWTGGGRRYNAQTDDDYYGPCKKEYSCDIRVYYDAVTLQNGTLMKSFKWRHTKPVKMWLSRFWSGKLDFHVSKPGAWESHEVLAIPMQHDQYLRLSDTILAVPYGWGQIDGKWCFLKDDGSLDWTKTSDEYKNKGKRQNFGVDVKETMDGAAWQMKTPTKNGRTLRSGRVHGADVDNFTTSQRFIATEYANDCVTLFEDAAKVAVAKVAEVAEVTPKKKAKVSFNAQPIVKIYTPPDRLTLDQLRAQLKEKDEYIQMLERTSELSKKVISGQNHVIEEYRKQLAPPATTGDTEWRGWSTSL